ncbi:uncharacterized protein LOC128242215 [Mya arenaria]|uniref:uncharacterized protein LOC128242215 n=1 Tax=Mya arenaria TaxID=6604 RepID=UPI0022E584B8|nr:uncharacterized protein LOC128242215 [Mya arenaria]
MTVVSKLSQHVGRYSKLFNPQSVSCILGNHINSNGITQQGRWKHSDSDNLKDPESGLPFYDSKKGMLVYTGPLTQNVTRIKAVSLTTSLVAVFAQPFVIAAAQEDMMMKAGVLGTISTIIFCTPVLLHLVAKKYVTDIYFNEDTKIFTFARKSFFLRRKEVEFRAEDVKLPFVGGLFVNHIIKGGKYFIDATQFRSKDIYKHMVGYDMPEVDDDEHNLETAKTSLTVKKGKKFGLFEDEEEDNENTDIHFNKKIGLMQDEPDKTSRRPKMMTPPMPTMYSDPVMMDDDDDGYVSHPKTSKQKKMKH